VQEEGVGYKQGSKFTMDDGGGQGGVWWRNQQGQGEI
jgi:hypothetical protein